MELKDYVQNVLQQIGEGIAECNGEKGNGNSIIVNPALKNAQFFEGEMYAIDSQKCYTKVIKIDFEVFITATSNSETDGRIGISVLGAGGSLRSEQSTTNKVKFSIPVLFPSAEMGK